MDICAEDVNVAEKTLLNEKPTYFGNTIKTLL